MNRRHAFRLLAGSSLALGGCGKTPAVQNFTAFAFGTQVGFQTHGVSKSFFARLGEKVLDRLFELESLFSLYQADSALRRLNRDGHLPAAPPEFVRLLRTALFYSEATGGLFDPTVQPLWDFMEKWKAADLTGRKKLEAEDWPEARALVDFRKTVVENGGISFARPGMAITLNALAQGHATDQILLLLREAGVENALVNIGEFAALGTGPDGKPWQVEIRADGASPPPRDLPAARALAVSAARGHTFDPEGRFHHLFRPTDGAAPPPSGTFVVESPSATEADALATTLAVATETERETILRKFPESRLNVW